jgi:predicted RNA-binding Zn-ribbon protein involved in translation (DUF1610 family)
MSEKEMTVQEMVELLDTEENKHGASGRSRILYLNVNGRSFGYVTSAKLAGRRDDIVTDVRLEIETDCIVDEIKIALERQKPKKLNTYNSDLPAAKLFAVKSCAECGNIIVGDGVYQYCPQCGQKIDWKK